MSEQLEPDNMLRVSIGPNREAAGWVVTTAYNGWKVAAKPARTRRELIDTVNEALERVLPGGDDDEIQVVLGPSHT